MTQGLGRLDLAVITLALGEPASSLNRQGRVARWIFGQRQGDLPLANPKLEQLRKYVIRRRLFGGRAATENLTQLHDAGYDQADLREIDRFIDRLSTAKRPRKNLQFTKRTEIFMPRLLSTYGRIIISTALLPLPFWSDVAYAQVSTPIDPPITIAEDVPGGPGGPGDGPDGDHIAIGVGGMYQPAFVGAKKYRFQPLPVIDIKQGMFFANFQNGIGVAPLDNETITVGIGVTMTDNYRRRDTPNRVNRVRMGAGARGFVAYRQFGLEASVGLTQVFAGGTRGMIADFNLSRPIMINERLFLNPSVTARWGNAKHNNRFYGVNAQQSDASGLREFRPGSGLLDAKAELGVQYRLTDHIGLGVMGGVSTLLGDNKDSPIVRKKTAPYGLGFISYNF